MAYIINGKYIADIYLKIIKRRIEKLQEMGNKRPVLAIVMAGDNEASKIYVSNKIKAANRIGIEAKFFPFPSQITEDNLLIEIEKLNKDPLINAIIVQLPLPIHINKDKIFSSLEASKDVDGLSPVNSSYIYNGNLDKGFIPCTALAVYKIISLYFPDLRGKKALVIGRSNLVGKPVAMLLLHHGASVTICHSQTKDLKSYSLNADIIVSAVGKAKFLSSDYFLPSAMVVDVGISRLEGKIAGDIDFDDVVEKISYITPVPGGIGPMTVACLLSNSLEAYLRQQKISL